MAFDTSLLGKTFEIEGKTFPIVGISKTDNEYVYLDTHGRKQSEIDALFGLTRPEKNTKNVGPKVHGRGFYLHVNKRVRRADKERSCVLQKHEEVARERTKIKYSWLLDKLKSDRECHLNERNSGAGPASIQRNVLDTNMQFDGKPIYGFFISCKGDLVVQAGGATYNQPANPRKLDAFMRRITVPSVGGA